MDNWTANHDNYLELMFLFNHKYWKSSLLNYPYIDSEPSQAFKTEFFLKRTGRLKMHVKDPATSKVI